MRGSAGRSFASPSWAALRSHTLLECVTIDRGQGRRSRLLDGADRAFDACDLVGLLLAHRHPLLTEHHHLVRAARGQRADEYEDTEDPDSRPIHQLILL